MKIESWKTEKMFLTSGPADKRLDPSHFYLMYSFHSRFYFSYAVDKASITKYYWSLESKR
jgi:hypothetical protein